MRPRPYLVPQMRCILGVVIRKPPRLFVLALLFWQVAVSMGVTVVNAAAPLEPRAPATLSGPHASATTLVARAAGDCPDHAARFGASGQQPVLSNHSSNHGCCGTVSACQCVTAAVPFVAPVLMATRFATPVPLLAYTSAAAAPVAPFFRPPIA